MSKPTTRAQSQSAAVETADDRAEEFAEQVKQVRETVTEAVEQVRTNVTDTVRQVSANRVMPEFFDGENQDAVEWIQAFNRIAKLNEWTDKQKILYMEISMKNRGLEWLETYEPPVTGDSYDARYQSFTNYFGKNAVVLQAEFLKCAQNPNESSKLYAERFIKLARRAGTSMNEKEKAMKFTIGLLPRLRKEVLRHAPSSVAAALQLCEANELADAFDQIDITSDNNTVLTLNNIDRVKDNNKVNNK